MLFHADAAARQAGKDLTFPIEQDNSNIRHYLARFHRRTKVVSKSLKMVELTMRLHHHLRDQDNFSGYAAKAITIFSQDSPIATREWAVWKTS